jgi:putative membrane protein
VAAAAAGSAHWLGGYWGGSAGLWMTVPVVLGAGLGYLLASWLPGLRRLLVPPAVLHSRVERRAALAFVTEEVFATRERTGILIFLALFERRVVVLADAGINAKVDQSEWDGIVAELRDGIRRGQPAAALVAAIGACGRLLHERKVEIRSDDTNELPDALRMADD